MGISNTRILSMTFENIVSGDRSFQEDSTNSEVFRENADRLFAGP